MVRCIGLRKIISGAGNSRCKDLRVNKLSMFEKQEEGDEQV